MTILAATQPDASSLISLLTLIVTSIGLLVGSYWVFFKRGEQSKDKIHDQDLVILKQDLEGQINKERGSREKEYIEVINKILAQGKGQESINKDIIKMTGDINTGLNESSSRWDEFIAYQKRWEDATSDKIQKTMLDVGSLNGKFELLKSTIGTESSQVKTMVEKFIQDSQSNKIEKTA